MAELVATYSLAACDLAAGQWGVATQSKFLAVGAVVPWAEPHVGAIATQAYANPRYGPEGLALLWAIDAVMDMARTCINVVGNCVATVVVAAWEKAIPADAPVLGPAAAPRLPVASPEVADPTS